MTRLPDEATLLAECDVDTYRASGPGGQKRNKTESAVRLRHRPSGFSVIAEESRSQHENRARALRRLRQMLALRLRRPVPDEGVPEPVRACIDKRGRLDVGRRDARYLPAAATVLDVLVASNGSAADAAKRLGITTGNLSDFLTGDDDLMLEANRIRAGLGLRPLRK
ncbi:MAG TPA: peptide chain release factor-like protein [Dehalococcoidia bacterium]|nr:peptide chain release factor-like protein [Dehalococcoidia bacterium]